MSTPPPSTPTNQDRQATHQVASVSASRNKTATPAHAPPRKASPTPAQAEDVPLLQLSEHQHCGHEVILPSASSAADLLSHLSDGLQHSDDLDFGNENNVVTEEQHQHQHQQLESPQQWQQWQQETSQQQAAEADSHQGQSLPESAKCGDLSGHPKEYLGQEIPLPSASAAAALLSMSYTATAPQSKRQKTRVSKPRSPLVDGADLDATRPRASTAPKSKVAAVAAAAASTAGKATTTTTTTTAVAAAAAPSPPVSTLEAPAAMQLPTANEVAATRGTQEHAGSEFLSIEAELGVDQESNDADQGMYHHQQQQQHHHLQQHQQSSSIEQDLGIDHQHMSIEEQIVVDQRSSIEQNLSIDGESLIEADLVMDDSIEAELGLDQGTCIDAEDVLLLRPDDNCEVDHAAALSHDASLWDEVVRADSNSQPNSTSYEAPQACYSSPLPSRRSEEREKALFSSPFVMFASPPVLAKPKTSSANPRAADSPGMSPFAMSMQGGNQLDEVAAEWNLQ